MARRVDLGKIIPEKGVDYYTEADKNEMEDEITNRLVGLYKRYESTYTTISADEDIIPIEIDQYDENCILEVYIEGRILNNDEYEVNNNSITLTNALSEVGTVVQFVVYKFAQVDSQDYDMLKGEKGDSGAIVFNNIAAMKNDNDLQVGDTCQTLGYYEPNDGGKLLYRIKILDNASNVELQYDENIGKYILEGISTQTGVPSLESTVNFEDTYPAGNYMTTINDTIYSFKLEKNLKNLDDSKDIFWLDINTGICGIKENIKEIILNGSEKWEKINNTQYSNSILRFRMPWTNNYKVLSTNNYISSNKLKGLQLSTRTENGVARQLDEFGINIFINSSYLDTPDVEGFISFLKNSNIIVRYRMDTQNEYLCDFVSLSNGLLAEQIKEEDLKFNNSQKSILDYKEYVSGNDWLPAFKQALSENIKSLYVPSGLYQISDTFLINNNMKIFGDGIGNSIIQLVSEETSRNAVLELKNSPLSCIRDISIQSSETGPELLGGLYIHSSDHVTLDNIEIKYINGTGLYMYFEGDTGATYDCRIDKVSANVCNGHGFYFNATDLFISNCTALFVKKHGFYFKRGNSLLLNCKAYWIGAEGDETTGDGFYLETTSSGIAHKIRLVNCEAQECGRHGFSLINTDNCQLIACQSDTNGMYCENIVPYGFYLERNRCLELIGTVVNQNLVGWTKVPLYFDRGDNNNIQITAQLLEYGTDYYKHFDKLYKIINYNPSNQIIINNNNVFPADYKNELYGYNLTDVASDFTFALSSPQRTTGQAVIDKIERSQKLSIIYSAQSQINDNAKIYKDFTISKTDFNKISMAVVCKTSNIYAIPIIRFRFYNNDTQISMSDYTIDHSGASGWEKYLSWNLYKLDANIPDNTNKIRVEMFIYLTQRALNAESGGDCWLKDFKLCCYNQ